MFEDNKENVRNYIFFQLLYRKRFTLHDLKFDIIKALFYKNFNWNFNT